MAWLALTSALVLCGLLPSAAFAQGPVLPPGCEDAVQSLLLPHRLGEPVVPAWPLNGIQIEAEHITLRVDGPEGERAELRLDHPDRAPRRARLVGSFAVSRPAASPAAAPALDALEDALGRNDDGHFWPEHQIVPTGSSGPSSLRYLLTLHWLDGLWLFAVFLGVLAILLGYALRRPRPDPTNAGAPHEGEANESDGESAKGPTRDLTSATKIGLALAAIAAVGVALRLTLPHAVGLEAWPYDRLFAPARLVFHGPLLGKLMGGPAWLSDVATSTTLVLACFAPITIFVHARYLLADRRAALVAAGILAVLPLHLRFSQSDVAFVGSMTISSLAFGMIHAATRERSRGVAALCLVLAAPAIAMTYLVRPDNMVYFPLLLATAFVNDGVFVDKQPPTRGRIALVGIVVCLVTFGFGLPRLFEDYAGNVKEGLSASTLLSAVRVAFSPTHNILINPELMPPGLAALAAFGAWDLASRRRWRLFAFLVGWLLMFLVVHAYVVPPEVYMQARYHLHLVIPFVLLATCGVVGLLARVAAMSARWRRAVPLGLALYLAASPLLHLHAIQFLDLNDPREWRFVHELRRAIPEGCTVLEYTGERAGSRFTRVGAYVRDGVPAWRFRVVDFTAPDPSIHGDTPTYPDEALALFADPPECLYWYAGLPCVAYVPPGHEGRQAPVCREISNRFRLETVAETTFPSRPYDPSLGMYLRPGQPITLTLHRVVGAR